MPVPASGTTGPVAGGVGYVAGSMTVDVSAVANRLIDAAATRVATTPFAEEMGMTVDAAYDIQDLTIERVGRPVIAAKLGLTSTAKQQQMNVSEALYGWMTDDMALGSDGRGTVERTRFIQPRVEPEIAFRMGADLGGPDVTAAAVIAATESVMPALDVLDSRFTGYVFTLADVAADNSSAAGFVLGDPQPISSDLALTGCVLEKNGQIVATAAGAAVMDHPAEAMAWFVRKLHQRGRSLPAGSLVLAGAWTAAIAIEPGDVVRATFDRYGSVEVTCT